jgi:hypothetical protein
VLLAALTLVGCFVAGVLLGAHGHEFIGLAIGLVGIPTALAVMIKWSDR